MKRLCSNYFLFYYLLQATSGSTNPARSSPFISLQSSSKKLILRKVYSVYWFSQFLYHFWILFLSVLRIVEMQPAFQSYDTISLFKNFSKRSLIILYNVYNFNSYLTYMRSIGRRRHGLSILREWYKCIIQQSALQICNFENTYSFDDSELLQQRRHLKKEQKNAWRRSLCKLSSLTPRYPRNVLYLSDCQDSSCILSPRRLDTTNQLVPSSIRLKMSGLSDSR